MAPASTLRLCLHSRKVSSPSPTKLSSGASGIHRKRQSKECRRLTTSKWITGDRPLLVNPAYWDGPIELHSTRKHTAFAKVYRESDGILTVLALYEHKHCGEDDLF